MKTIRHVLTVTGIVASLCCSPLVLSTMGINVGGVAQAAEQKTKKVPAMRERVYSQLARAQKIAEEQGVDAGITVLDEVAERAEQMNSYERAMLWNFYGFTYYNAEKIDKAVESFNKVVAEEAIPESLMLSTLFSLAQLSMMQDNYEQTLRYLTRWQKANPKPLTANEHILFAQVHYQTKQFEKALAPLNAAIALTEKENKPPKENWLVLQRAVYFELKQPENVTRVLEKMVRLFNKPKYWIQLAGMYGETGAEDKQLAVMESAWQAGFIDKESDMSTLAQLYLYNNVPFKAGQIMAEGIEQGVIKRNLKNLEFLAQAWMMAKENEKALPVLRAAAELSDNGNNYAILAETLVNLEQWQPAIDAAKLALQKGGLKNEGNMHIAQGIAYFNLKSFDYSLAALKDAQQHKNVAQMAANWRSFVQREKQQQESLAMLR